ncbi:P2Y purinoceptor 13-like isoform X2 [Tachysurus fulvidraco]|nr:P2Y purinoceptor 13-like isoform X2 [Tachysurus fulvidraco]XP_026998699.1 P2Y purinoceptor 13-like isoform X2 [Tachysurus fulvidraco]
MASNTTTNSTKPVEDCGINMEAWALALPSLYFAIFPPALLLNLVVAWICLHLKTNSNFMVYLKHLVAADLLMTMTYPIRGASELPGASDGLHAFACRFSSVFFYLAMNMSVILMGLISLDRYLKIVRSGGSLLCQNLLFSNILSFFFWFALICSNTLPIIITSNQDPTNKTGEFCIAMKSKLGIAWHEAVIIISKVIFWAVCILNVFCYTFIAKTVLESYQRSRGNNDKRKRKAKFRVFLILLVFFICYLPYHSIRIPYTNLQVQANVTCYKQSLRIGKDFTLWLSAINVCLDPLIYFFLCRDFRERFLEICDIKSLFPSYRKNKDASQTTDTSQQAQ